MTDEYRDVHVLTLDVKLYFVLLINLIQPQRLIQPLMDDRLKQQGYFITENAGSAPPYF